jgi:hypothetical protein
MNLSVIIGTHYFSEGTISIEGARYTLQVARSKTNNPSSPNLQLIYKSLGSPFHDTRLSGLFEVKDMPGFYKGDVIRNGKKHRFTISIDKLSKKATITME